MLWPLYSLQRMDSASRAKIHEKMRFQCSRNYLIQPSSQSSCSILSFLISARAAIIVTSSGARANANCVSVPRHGAHRRHCHAPRRWPTPCNRPLFGPPWRPADVPRGPEILRHVLHCVSCTILELCARALSKRGSPAREPLNLFRDTLSSFFCA